MSRRPHPSASRTVLGRTPRAAAAAIASCALLAAAAPAASAAEACGTQAAVQPFVDHVNTAHLERSPLQQVRDLLSIDSYVLAHTVLIESMIAPFVPTTEGVLTPLEEHLETAHLERSPMQQVQDLINVDDYVLAHTVLVESMLDPVLAGCGAPASPGMPPAHGAPPAPAEPPPAAPAQPAPPASTQTVAIHNYAFMPKSLTVAPGTTVTWANLDADNHTVTQSGGSALKSKSLGKDATFAYTFTQPGTYAYVCSLHSQMKGSVTVQ